MSGEKLSRELQETLKKSQSHDLLAVPIDYELPKTDDDHRPIFDGASADLIFGVDLVP